jgi:hypothetical protein
MNEDAHIPTYGVKQTKTFYLSRFQKHGKHEKWFCGKNWHKVERKYNGLTRSQIHAEIEKLISEGNCLAFKIKEEYIYEIDLLIYNGISFDSYWEVVIAKRLDLLGVRWVKNQKVHFEYTDEHGKTRTSQPDFWLPDYGIFVDPHSERLMVKDQKKIEILEEKYGGIIVWLDTLDKCKNFSIDGYEPVGGYEPVSDYEPRDGYELIGGCKSTKEKIKERIKNNVVLYGSAFYRVMLDWADILIKELMVCFCRKV